MVGRPLLLSCFAALVSATGHAQSSSLFVSSNVMTGFTWNPATSAGNGTSASCAVGAAPVQYFLEPFWTDTTAGTYGLSLSYPSYQAAFVYVYRDAFDPQDPCTGIVAFGLGPFANIASIQLDANRQYVFVTAEDSLFGGGGAFNAMITGPQGSNLFRGFRLPSLNSPVTTISTWAGGDQPWDLDAGAANAGRFYLVVGSLSGTSPGIPLTATLTLPLNPDGWFAFTASMPNVPPLFESLGFLDATGRMHAAGLSIPSGVLAGLGGIRVDHAFVVADGGGAVTFVSNPLPLYLAF